MRWGIVSAVAGQTATSLRSRQGGRNGALRREENGKKLASQTILDITLNFGNYVTQNKRLPAAKPKGAAPRGDLLYACNWKRGSKRDDGSR